MASSKRPLDTTEAPLSYDPCVHSNILPKRRISVFATYFHPHVGGYEKIVYELSRKPVERGYEIDIHTCNTERAPAYFLECLEFYISCPQTAPNNFQNSTKTSTQKL